MKAGLLLVHRPASETRTRARGSPTSGEEPCASSLGGRCCPAVRSSGQPGPAAPPYPVGTHYPRATQLTFCLIEAGLPPAGRAIRTPCKSSSPRQVDPARSPPQAQSPVFGSERRPSPGEKSQAVHASSGINRNALQTCRGAKAQSLPPSSTTEAAGLSGRQHQSARLLEARRTRGPPWGRQGPGSSRALRSAAPRRGRAPTPGERGPRAQWAPDETAEKPRLSCERVKHS